MNKINILLEELIKLYSFTEEELLYEIQDLFKNYNYTE